MRKRLLLASVFLSVIAAGASAMDIKPFTTAPGIQYAWTTLNGYNVAGISDDGSTIVATNSGGVAVTINVATAAQTTWKTGYGRGLGVWAGSGTYNTIIQAGVNGTAGNPPKASFGRNPANNYGALKDSAGASTNNTVPAAFNSTSIDWTLGNGWMVGGGMGTYPGTGMAWKITGGNFPTTPSLNAAWQQTLGTGITNGRLNGVSNAGVGVGLSSTLGPILADLNNNTAGSIKDIVAYAGADAAGGGANGVSANATVNGSISGTGFVGGFFKNGGWRHGFVLDLTSGDDAVATELFPISGVYGASEETEVFDVSDNGIAVGYDLAGGVNTAAVWLPGQTTARSLESILAAGGVSLPTNFSRLSYAVSITAVPNNNGLYSIAGQGVLATGGTAAFVATIPEPATLAFLALGGLAMLRRRR